MAPPRWSALTKSKVAVDRAKARFPDCQFFAQSWEQLPEGRFDVILLASALHYAEDQAALIHRLMDSLQDDGTLVLEIGLAPSGKSEWVRVKRSIDERLFPSRGKLGEILEDYAWKIVGYSVQQAGDPCGATSCMFAGRSPLSSCCWHRQLPARRRLAEPFLPKRRSR
jgi:SAM-dependent methyltransferase